MSGVYALEQTIKALIEFSTSTPATPTQRGGRIVLQIVKSSNGTSFLQARFQPGTLNQWNTLPEIISFLSDRTLLAAFQDRHPSQKKMINRAFVRLNENCKQHKTASKLQPLMMLENLPTPPRVEVANGAVEPTTVFVEKVNPFAKPFMYDYHDSIIRPHMHGDAFYQHFGKEYERLKGESKTVKELRQSVAEYFINNYSEDEFLQKLIQKSIAEQNESLQAAFNQSLDPLLFDIQFMIENALKIPTLVRSTLTTVLEDYKQSQKNIAELKSKNKLTRIELNARMAYVRAKIEGAIFENRLRRCLHTSSKLSNNHRPIVQRILYELKQVMTSSLSATAILTRIEAKRKFMQRYSQYQNIEERTAPKIEANLQGIQTEIDRIKAKAEELRRTQIAKLIKQTESVEGIKTYIERARQKGHTATLAELYALVKLYNVSICFEDFGTSKTVQNPVVQDFLREINKHPDVIMLNSKALSLYNAGIKGELNVADFE